ncbi:hypothetical protein Ac2012v2_007369, partial [Leucoagaricus gongylophorus]
KYAQELQVNESPRTLDDADKPSAKTCGWIREGQRTDESIPMRAKARMKERIISQMLLIKDYIITVITISSAVIYTRHQFITENFIEFSYVNPNARFFF